jgi:hypothetical protein
MKQKENMNKEIVVCVVWSFLLLMWEIHELRYSSDEVYNCWWNVCLVCFFPEGVIFYSVTRLISFPKKRKHNQMEHNRVSEEASQNKSLGEGLTYVLSVSVHSGLWALLWYHKGEKDELYGDTWINLFYRSTGRTCWVTIRRMYQRKMMKCVFVLKASASQNQEFVGRERRGDDVARWRVNSPSDSQNYLCEFLMKCIPLLLLHW